MAVEEIMSARAPYPQPLQELVENIRYWDGWSFSLVHEENADGSQGLTLRISVISQDSYHPEKQRGVTHPFFVPPCTYNYLSWQRWLFARIMDVHLHEAMEGFRIISSGDPGAYERPFAPRHGPGNNPYAMVEYVDEVERRTLQDGTVKD